VAWIFGIVGAAAAVFVVAMVVVFWRVGARASLHAQASARASFEAMRGELEATFFAAAAASGRPRGLRWKGCEWEPGAEFAREIASGKLAALVGVTIQFEAVEGGDMEGLPAVGNLRNASAVFFFHEGQWRTTGKTVFNLNPDEVLARFKDQYERFT
jgi:hypothetical protein